MRRFLIFLLVTVILVSMAIPAFGLGVDYRDLIEGFETIDGQSYAVFSLPANYTIKWSIPSEGTSGIIDESSYIDINMQDTPSMTIQVRWKEDEGLDPSVFPSGTKICSTFGIFRIDNSPAFYPGTVSFKLMGYRDGKAYTQDTATQTALLDQYMTLTTTVQPVNSEYTSLYLRWDFRGMHAIGEQSYYQVRFYFVNLRFLVSVDSLYLQFQQGQKTNELLSAVESKLKENGQKLDDILSGDSLDHSKIDDVDTDIGNIDRDISSSIDQIEDSFNFESPTIPNVMGMIDMDVAGNVNAVLMPLWDSPLFLSLLLISLGLMLVGYVLFGKR